MKARWNLWQAQFAVALAVAASACGDASGTGPDPISPQFYNLQLLDNGSLPAVLFTLPFGGIVYLQSATLVPYAVGRTIDQRLVNDRTGRGGSGGNTRDTTVARGQMMDIRVLKEGSGITSVLRRDSTLVDVEVRDTMMIITRPHPDPTRVKVDTGYFVDDLLVVSTLMDYQQTYGAPVKRMILNYKITR